MPEQPIATLDYDVTKPEELAGLFDDLEGFGFSITPRYMDTWTMKWQETQEGANYLWILARKKHA